MFIYQLLALWIITVIIFSALSLPSVRLEMSPQKQRVATVVFWVVYAINMGMCAYTLIAHPPSDREAAWMSIVFGVVFAGCMYRVNRRRMSEKSKDSVPHA